MESGCHGEHVLTFPEIHEIYQPKIVRYLATLIDEYEAEDLAQEVFAKLGRNLETFRGEARLSTWIYRIATNLAIDRIRHCTLPFEDHRNRADDLDVQLEDRNTWTGELPHSAEQLLIRAEMTDCIRSCLAKLPEHYRVVLALNDSEGFRAKEIAEIAGITLDTVKIRLHRARALLRKEIEINCRVYRDERNELACEPTVEFPPGKE